MHVYTAIYQCYWIPHIVCVQEEERNRNKEQGPKVNSHDARLGSAVGIVSCAKILSLDPFSRRTLYFIGAPDTHMPL